MNKLNMDPRKLSVAEKQWKQQRPDLPVEDAVLIGLLTGTGLKLVDIGEEALAPYKLTTSEHDVLACLRRQGKPYLAKPKSILEELKITSGALTTLANRLIKRGYLIRVKDKNDKRSLPIMLTSAGIDLIDQITTIRFNLCKDLSEVLNDDEKLALKKALLKVTLAANKSKEN